MIFECSQLALFTLTQVDKSYDSLRQSSNLFTSIIPTFLIEPHHRNSASGSAAGLGQWNINGSIKVLDVISAM